MKLAISIIMAISICACCNYKDESYLRIDYSSASPNVIVYNIKADYFDKVPITLSEDKKSILSYPDPKDLIVDGVYFLPTKLEKGYLLDNRGISINTVFLNITLFRVKIITTIFHTE